MADLKADPFWGGADWELVEARKMPSPLAEHAQMMANQDQASADGVTDGTGASLATIMREMERADAQQKQVEVRATAGACMRFTRRVRLSHCVRASPCRSLRAAT